MCERGGQACDLRVPGVSSEVVAEFIWRELPFDRVYLYGADRPLHVSWGPKPLGMVVRMERSRSGRLVPRVVRGRPWAERGEDL